MPDEDDFGAQLASMDRGQLQALMAELEFRSTRGFPTGHPGVAEPGIRQGAFQDPTKDAEGNTLNKNREHYQNVATKEASVYYQYKKYRGRKKDKKAKAAYEEEMNNENIRQKKIVGERMKSVQGQLRTIDLRDKISTQFRDLELEGLFDRTVKQGLDANVLGISQQYEDLTRQSGFDTVAKGLGGGSSDAERIADIQSSQEGAIARAASQAQTQRRGLSQNLDNQRRSLLSSVSGSNPGEEARLRGELSNIQNQANTFSQQAGQGMYGMGIDQEGYAGQSQAIGGLLSSYANLYNSGTARSY